MKLSSRWLISIALGVAAQVAFASESKTFLVGEHKLTQAALEGKLKGQGKVLGKTAEGFFRVAPAGKATMKQLGSALKGAKIEFVFRGDANDIDPRNLYSVEEHIDYKKGGYKIRTGEEPKEGDAEGIGVDFYEALEWYLSVRADPATGMVDRDKYMAGARHRDLMPPATSEMLDPGVKRTAAPAAWAFVGPQALDIPYQQYYGQPTLSGRKNWVTQAPSNPSIIYTASAGGGLWKCVDNGFTFTPMSDKWQFTHTNCVAVHPTDPNTVYVGTGDYKGFFNQLSFGIMKSTDGGTTWTNLGNAQFGDSVVTRIKISNANPNIVIALTAGPSGDIWRSTDAGATWARTNAPNGDWQDFDSSASDITWVAAGAGVGIYQSLDEGATWNVKTTPVGSGGSLWDIAVSKLDFNDWYMICSNRSVHKSTDRGVTWTNITTAFDTATSNATYNWSQRTYDMYIHCGKRSDDSQDIVVAGLITVSVSDDSGATWYDGTRSFETNSKWHNDQHCATTQGVGGGQNFILGGDGGLVATQWNTTSHTFSSVIPLNSTIKDTQFYTIAVHPSDSSYVMGGTQDNATPASRGAAAGGSWKNLYAGDGAGAAFDKASPGLHYTGSQGGNVWRYTTANDLTPDSLGPGGGLFISPLVCAGASGSIPFLGRGSSLAEWNGASWTNRNTGGGSIRAIAVSKFTNQRMYTAATNGDVYRTGNSAASFTKADGTTLPNESVGGLAESPFTPDYMIAGIQRVGNPAVVWRTADASAATPTWSNISGSGLTALPSLPVNDVERDTFNYVYYAATDVGVFVSPDEGAHWYNMNAMGLPNVPVYDLWIYQSGGTSFLYAATFGRGIWRCLLSNRVPTALTINKPAIWGGQQNTLTFKLNGAAPSGTLVTLSDSSSSVSIPSSFEMPLGSTQYSFTAFTANPAATETVTVSARAWGTTISNSFTLHRIPAFTYTPQSPNIYGGNRFNATIDMLAPIPIGAVFTFSDNAVQVASPSATSIAAGGQTRTVALYTATVGATVNALISAKLANTTATSAVALQPRPDLLSVSVSPNSVVGGSSTTGTVTMNFAGAAGPQTVNTSDSSAIATTPPNVVVPGGATSQTFTINTNVVTASFNVTIKAQLRGITKAATLNVHP